MSANKWNGEAEDDPGDIIQWLSSVYFCREGEAVELQLLRLGRAQHPCAVEFFTVDGSARGGVKFVSTEGRAEFDAGETSKKIRVQILENESFDTTLEFEVHLRDPEGAVLGCANLYKCRVVISDDDWFPTNRFAEQLEQGRNQEIPGLLFVLEYFRMHLTNCKIRWAVFFFLVADQIKNLFYVWNILLLAYLIDTVLKRDPNEEPLENPSYHIFVCILLLLAPHPLVLGLDLCKVNRRIPEMCVCQLQQNLVRKVLHYDEISREALAPGDIHMAMTRDVPDVVFLCFLNCLKMIKHIGLLILLFAMSLIRSVDAVMAICIFLAFPLAMILFLGMRFRETVKRHQGWLGSQTELASCLHQATDCYRMITDYMQKPATIDAFSQKVARSNDAYKTSARWNAVNDHFAPCLTHLLVSIFILSTFQRVLDGREMGGLAIGMFLSELAIWKSVGKSYEDIYELVLIIQSATAPLHNLVFYMNLHTDTEQRLQVSRGLLVEGKRAIKHARTLLYGGGDAHGHLEGGLPKKKKGKNRRCSLLNSDDLGPKLEKALFSEDLIMIRCRNVMFAYPQRSGGGTRILDGASFEFAQGQLVAVTGPRGSGKATLVSLVGSVYVPSFGNNGELFVPPHLRVLHVGHQPQIRGDMTLFDNLCFGPSDGDDEAPQRVLAICRRLGMRSDLVELLEAEQGLICGEFIKRDTAEDDPSRKQRVSRHTLATVKKSPTLHVGSAYSVAVRKGADLMANDGALLSHTDRCLIHLARALVMNPEFLVMHKPMEHFDDVHAKMVVELLREFVDKRGVEKPTSTWRQRRPRTCIYSCSSVNGAERSDLVLNISNGKVATVDVDMFKKLRVKTKELFAELDHNDDENISKEEFVSALKTVPWAMEMLDIVDDEDLRNIFDSVDVNRDGTLQFEELVKYIQGRMYERLPQMVAIFQKDEERISSKGKAEKNGVKWDPVSWNVEGEDGQTPQIPTSECENPHRSPERVSHVDCKFSGV